MLIARVWVCVVCVCVCFKILFVYLIKRDTAREREGTQAGGVGEGEADFLQSREASVGLDPRTPGS